MSLKNAETNTSSDPRSSNVTNLVVVFNRVVENVKNKSIDGLILFSLNEGQRPALTRP